VWILSVFVVIESGKVSIWIAVHSEVGQWPHDDSFITGSLEVATDTLEGIGVLLR
jgi:hypothetical protein